MPSARRRPDRSEVRVMVILLGLAAAVLYGSGDFLGGMATRRAPVLAVLTVANTARSGQWQWSSASRRVVASPLSGGEPAITGSGGALGCSCMAGRWPASRRGSP